MNKRPPIFNPKNAIPEQSVVANDGLLEVIVADIFSPHDFFIQLKGDTSRSLETLMNSMEDFYDNHGDHYKVSDSSLVEGFVCASQFTDGNWYRARVSSLDMAGVQVFYLDYGTTTVVQRDSLRYLLQQFSDLPCQAIKAKLFGVMPTSEEWPVEAANRFLQLVAGPSEGGGVLAYVRSVGRELSLWLVDTVTNNLENGIQINQVLVNEGLALAADGSNDGRTEEVEETVIQEEFEVSEEDDEDLQERHGRQTHVNGASNIVQKLVDEMKSRLSVDKKPFEVDSTKDTGKDDKDQHRRNKTATQDNPRYSVTTSRALLKNVMGAPPFGKKPVSDNDRNGGRNTTEEDNSNKSGRIAMPKVMQKYDTGTAQDLSKKDTKEDDSIGKISTARAMFRSPNCSIRPPLRRPFDSSSPKLRQIFASSSSSTSTSSDSSFGAEDSSSKDTIAKAMESTLGASGSTPQRGQGPSRSNLLSKF